MYRVFSATATQCADGGQLDLAFLLDSSGSINYADPSNWRRILNFSISIVNSRLIIGPSATQVAVILFSNDAPVSFHLNTNSTGIKNAVSYLPYLDGRTDLNDALYLTRTDVFAPGNGARTAAGKVAIIITDGADNTQVEGIPLTLQNATLLKQAGVHIVAIAVTNQVDVSRLLQIVSSPSDLHNVSNFSQLPTLLISLGLNQPANCTATPSTHLSSTLHGSY